MKTAAKAINSVKILNYGCSANRAIAEGLMGILKENGYIISESIKDAKIIVINTCIVKQNTEHRMKSLLLSFSSTKKLIVTGCLPIVMRNWLTENVPHAKILMPENADQIIKLLQKEEVPETKIDDSSLWYQLYETRRICYNPVITVVEISRGCLGNCSFCIVKQVKGNIRSRPQESIVKEVQKAINKGSKEIWLTSQDTGVYGWDFSTKQSLSSLVESIVNIKGNFLLRLGMMTPSTIKKILSPLVDQLNKNKVYSFLHLPIQSGSDTILQAMNRKETRNYFFNLVDKLKKEVPELVLATDIIVGFPGESSTDFKATKDLLEYVKPEIVNISRYTDRFGTAAAKMDNKVPTHIKSERSKELSQLTQNISKETLKRWIGWKGLVLIDEYGKNSNQFIGRNLSYLPVLIRNEELVLGQFIIAKIVESRSTYLIGEITEESSLMS